MSDHEEKLNKILNSIVKEKYPDASNVKINPISSDGANYSSVLYEASINTPKGTQELFAKVAALGQLGEAGKESFVHENFVLTSLLSAYEELQDKYVINDRFMFPKFYKYDCVDGVPILVLENLTSKGYECYDRFKVINWKYASKSVEVLAKFHALSLALKKENPEEFRKADNILKLSLEVIQSPHFESASDAAMSAVDEQDKEKLSQILDGSIGFSKMMDLYEPRKTSVLIHGDYRASNLMHKEMNGEYNVIPVDYQTARVGCPAADLLYFIVMGTDQQFRQQYYQQLVDHYYDHLAQMMTKLGLQPEEIYEREEFEGDLKAKLPIALCVAATVLPFVTVQPESAPNFESGHFVPRSNKLFVERFRGLMHDFKEWGVI